jgi:hypothetical protein
LCENIKDDGSMEGITENYIRVRLSAEEVQTHELSPNQRVSVIINAVENTDFVSAIVIYT